MMQSEQKLYQTIPFPGLFRSHPNRVRPFNAP